jgi:hypothetical protein
LEIFGDAISSQRITIGQGVRLHGSVKEYQPRYHFPPLQFEVGDKNIVLNNETKVLEPGRYGDVLVIGRAKLILKSGGKYYFRSLYVGAYVPWRYWRGSGEVWGIIIPENTTKPVEIYVKTGNLRVSGRPGALVNQTKKPPMCYIYYAGTGWVSLSTTRMYPFYCAVYAPNCRAIFYYPFADMHGAFMGQCSQGFYWCGNGQIHYDEALGVPAEPGAPATRIFHLGAVQEIR